MLPRVWVQAEYSLLVRFAEGSFGGVLGTTLSAVGHLLVGTSVVSPWSYAKLHGCHFKSFYYRNDDGVF